jgi:TolB-like protein
MKSSDAMNTRLVIRRTIVGGTICLLAGCGGTQPGTVTPARNTAAEQAAKDAIANERALDVATLAPQSLGIPPFRVAASDTTLSALGYGLADLLTTDLARSGRLQVVDRLRLDAVLREISLVESGRVDTATAPRVGKLVQARRLVLGGLTETPGGGLAINAEVADVASGEVREAVSASAPLADILRAEKELAFRLFDQLGVTLTPAERGLVEQLPTKNVAAVLAYSRGVRFEAEGRYGEARDEYQRAVQLDPGFRGAQEHFEDAGGEPVPAAPGPQVTAGINGLADKVVGGINGPFLSPLGSQLIAPPGAGGSDLTLPATVTIIVERPQ